MKVTYLNSASVIIQNKETKILCDPWLVNGEFFNAWGIYPPYDFTPEKFNDIDFIYISHIHSDHLSLHTLSKIKKDIPVIIYNFPDKVLKNKIESMGLSVIELSNNSRTQLVDNLHINILLADNCDPEICTKAFGCGQFESKFKVTPMDTMAIFDNGEQKIVNTNDCPPELSSNTLLAVKELYGSIDLLLVGYLGASSYPQAYNLPNDILEVEKTKKTQLRLNGGKIFVNILKPKFFIPFAGQYTLTGKFSYLNSYRGEPELDDAFNFFSHEFSGMEHKCILLNQNETFDLDTEIIPKYKKLDKKKKQKYIDEVFSKFKYNYEFKDTPSLSQLKNYIPKSFEKFEERRKQIGFSSDTVMLLKLTDDLFVKIYANGKKFEYCNNNTIENLDNFLMISCDTRLLKWLLQGPRKANWDTASLGSHLSFHRQPNVHNRGLNYCWNWFYSEIYDD